MIVEGQTAGNVRCGGACQGLKLSRFGFPGTGLLFVEREGRTVDGKGDLLCLARLKEDLLEGFQFLDGTFY